MNHVEQIWSESLARRAGWKTQTFEGVPARVRFTTGDLRKMSVDRNTLNQITGVKKPRSKRRGLAAFSTDAIVAELMRRVKED